MVALEVLVNGKRRYVAGHIDAGILTVTVQTWMRLVPEMISPTFNLHSSVSVPIGGGQFDTMSYPSDRLSVGDDVLSPVLGPFEARKKPERTVLQLLNVLP